MSSTTSSNNAVLTPPPPSSSVSAATSVDDPTTKTSPVEEILLVASLAANPVDCEPDIQPTERTWEEPVVDAKPDICPKCASTTPWKESSWCPACGYYPGVSDVQTQASPTPIQEEVEAEGNAPPPPLLPAWIVQLMVVNTSVFVFAIGARYFFTFYDASLRGIVALTMVVVGFLLMAVNHLRATMSSMDDNADITPFDYVSKPIEMWRTTLRGLPKTGGRIVWAVAGFSILISGQFIIGGIDYASFFERKEKAKQPDLLKQVTSRARQAAPEMEEMSMEEALNKVADGSDVLGDESDKLPSPGEPLTCFIYGFMRDGDDAFGRILLASDVGGERQHVAVIPGDNFNSIARQALAKRLAPLITKDNSIETQYRGATWVRPSVGLPIEFTGWSFTGEMVNPIISRSTPSAPPSERTEVPDMSGEIKEAVEAVTEALSP